VRARRVGQGRSISSSHRQRLGTKGGDGENGARVRGTPARVGFDDENDALPSDAIRRVALASGLWVIMA
jgi:hypothetical protein